MLRRPSHERYADEGPSCGGCDGGRWAGSVITTYPFDNPQNMKNAGQAKRILQKWLETGLLIEAEYRSEKQRKDRKCVRANGRVGEQN